MRTPDNLDSPTAQEFGNSWSTVDVRGPSSIPPFDRKLTEVTPQWGVIQCVCVCVCPVCEQPRYPTPLQSQSSQGAFCQATMRRPAGRGLPSLPPSGEWQQLPSPPIPGCSRFKRDLFPGGRHLVLRELPGGHVLLQPWRGLRVLLHQRGGVRSTLLPPGRSRGLALSVPVP